MAMLSQKALCNFRTEKKTRVTFNFQDDDTHTHKIKWFLLLNAIGIGGGSLSGFPQCIPVYILHSTTAASCLKPNHSCADVTFSTTTLQLLIEYQTGRTLKSGLGSYSKFLGHI